ncbi:MULTISPECIES: hypothetical protein [unclassified Nostoc]|uniref:hypothetical protein n=1 Tax=unclassified Nostoc TaxID=2593658 RepID=UPI001D713D71|nr:hypothetical protein [Nostoc sp. JL23]MBN3875727.1 hypothetical protein [Nostoc sp. JL23]
MIAGNKIITQLGKIGTSISSDRDRTLAQCLLKIALRIYREKLMNNQPNHKNFSPQETPCPICGSQNFVWGRTVGESVSQWVYFRADEAGWGEGEKLRTRKCKNCNNVQLFTYD